MQRSLTIAAIAVLAIGASACDRAQANKQTLWTDDCGITTRIIPTGQAVPKAMTTCQYSVTLPNYPMQGDLTFRTAFAGSVLAGIEGSYDYSILEPALYVKSAKFLARPNADSSDDNTKSYELAENSVIDKVLRDVISEAARSENIATFDQAKFEDKVLAATNERLAEKGVKLNYMSLVPVADAQTRLAIDAVTARNVYKSAGLEEYGQAIAVARAGATVININPPQAAPATNDEGKK